MSFAIRSFDFRAMSAANSGASIDKLNEIIDSHTEVTMQVRELAREERTLDASIEETTSGLAQYEGNLSDDQLKEIRGYLDSANDRLCEVIEQREAAEEIRHAREREIERMAEMLGVQASWESIGDGYPTYNHVVDFADVAKAEVEMLAKTAARNYMDVADDYSNENIYDRMVRYNTAIYNETEPDRDLLMSIYQMANEQGIRLTTHDGLILAVNN